jgi:polyphosphate kinase
LIKKVTDILEIQFRDTLKARIIDKHQVNGYVKRGNRKHSRLQIEIYQYLKHLEKAEYDRNKNGAE